MVPVGTWSPAGHVLKIAQNWRFIAMTIFNITNKCFTNSKLVWLVTFRARSLMRKASEHNLDLELAAGFTHKLKKYMAERKLIFHNDWEQEIFFN